MGLYIQAQIGSDKYILYPSEDQPVLLDISSIENGEIGELLGDLSQDFQIPATEEHNRFFQHAFEVGHQDIPGVYNSVEVTLNNEEQTLFQGSMTLKEWDEAEGIYTCAIESSIINLKDRLDGLELQRAPGWSTYDHSYSMDEWVRTNTVQDTGYDALDYFYPFVDYGYDKDGRSRFESNQEIAVSGRATQSSYVYQSSTTPGQAGDLFGDTFNGINAGSLYYPNDAGDLEAAQSIITSSPWFGEVSQSSYPLQGFISHPSTPLRIEQLKPAIKLSTCLDRVFELANLMDVDGVLVDRPGVPVTYEAPFLDMQKDVFVLPNLLGADGIVASTPNVGDGFIATQANTPGVDVDSGSSSTTDERDITQFTFGDSSVTPSYNPSGNLQGGAYVVPNPGTYEFEFSGGFTVTSTTLAMDILTTQFVINQAVLWVNGVIMERSQLEWITRDTPDGAANKRDWSFTWRGNLKVGDRVEVGLISSKHKGNRNAIVTTTDWEFRTNQVANNWSSSTVQLGLQFMDTSALDFLKGVVQKQNLVIYKDKTRRNHYIIRQYNDWILGGQLIEWSDRVGPLVQSNLLSEQPRQLLFADSETDDRFNKIEIDKPTGLTYGAFEHVSDDEGITDGDKDIGDFFSPLIPGALSYAHDLQKTSNPAFGGIPQLYEFEDGEKKILDTGIHIGYSFCTSVGKFYYQVGDKSIAYNDVVRTLSNVNEDAKRNLNWADGRYNTFADSAYELYWSQYIDHLYNNNNVKVSTTVLLSPTEYQTLNINDTVHINGNDYLINKISGFNLTEPAEVDVELISYKNNFTNVYEAPTIRYVNPTDPDIRTAIVGVNVIALNDVDGSLVPWDIPILQQNMTQIRLEGIKDSEVTETLNIRKIDGYRFDLSGSNFTPTLPVPAGITVGTPIDNGDDVDIPITVVIQEEHTFDYLEITGEVDQLVSGDQTVKLEVSLQTGITGVTIDNPSISQFGQIGDSSTFRVFLSADSNTTQILVSTIQTNASSIGDLTFVTATDFGTGAELIFTGVIKETVADGTYNVVITQANVGNIDPGASTVTHTVTFAEPNLLNVSINPTSITYTGEPDETHDFILNVSPASGYRVVASAWQVHDDVDLIVNDTGYFQDGYNAGINVVLRTPSTTLTTPTNVNVTGAPGILIGAETRTNTITIDAPGSNYSFQGFSEQTDSLEVVQENVPKTKGIFQLDVTPDELFTFTDPDTLGFNTSGEGLEYIGASIAGGSILANFEYIIGDEPRNSAIHHGTDGPMSEENSIKFIFNNIGLDGAIINTNTTAGEPPTGELNVGYTGNAGSAIVDPATSNNYVISITAKDGVFPENNPDGTVNADISISVDNTAITLLKPGGDPNNIDDFVQYEPTNERVVDGVFLFDLTGSFPTFGGNHVVTFDITGTPGLKVAEEGAFATDLYTLSTTGGLPSVSFTADGIVEFAASSTSGTLSTPPGFLVNPRHTVLNAQLGNGRVYAPSVIPGLGSQATRTGYWLMFKGSGRTDDDIIAFMQIIQQSASSNADVTGFQTSGVNFIGGSNGGAFIYTDSTGAQRASYVGAGQTVTECVLDSVAGVMVNQGGSGGTPASATANSGHNCPIGTAGTAGTYADDSGSTNGMTFMFVGAGGTPTNIPDNTIYFEYE